MSEKVIASLIGKLRFDADATGLLKFERLLDQVARKMAQFERQATRLNRRLGIAPKGSANIQKQLAASAKQTNAEFQSMLRTSKLQLATEQQQVKLQTLQAKAGQQQARQATAQSRAQLQQLKTQQATQAFSLRQEQSRLKLQQEQLRTSAAHSRLEATRARTQAASDRARIQAMRLEERLNRSLPKGMRSPSGRAAPAPSQSIWRGGRGFGSSMGHMASAGLGGGIGASIPGLGMFGMNLHPAAIGLGAVATAAVLAQSKLNAFAKTDISSRDERMVERANFRVATGSPAAATQAENRLTALANDLGIVRSEIARPYTMATINLTEAGMSPEESATMLQGLMSFGRGAGVSTDDQAGALRAIQQSLSKGQLYSEEMRQQLAERLPGAWNAAAEAWSRQTKSGLTGNDASLRFSEDMADRKIAGKPLVEFWKQFGQVLQERSNAGGRLDEVRQSADASKARLQNVELERSIRTAEFNDGALKQSSIELYRAKERLQVSLEKLIPGFSTLESASLKLEARFVDGSTNMVVWLEKLQSKISELTSDPKALQYFDRIGTKLDQFVMHIEPLLDLLTDIITFMNGVALEKLGDNFSILVSRLDAAWTMLEPILGEIPDTFDAVVTRISDSVNKLFRFFGLDREWQQHRDSNKGGYTGRPYDAPAPLPLARPSPLIPTINPSVLEQLATNPAQAMQQLIDSSTTNTNNVQTNSFAITVNASGANASEVYDEISGRIRELTTQAARGVFADAVTTTQQNLVRVR